MTHPIVETPEQFKQWAKGRKMELVEEMAGFKVGDTVTFTNEFGISFPNLKVIGIETDTTFYGKHIYLNSDCYWFPKSPESLTKQTTE